MRHCKKHQRTVIRCIRPLAHFAIEFAKLARRLLSLTRRDHDSSAPFSDDLDRLRCLLLDSCRCQDLQYIHVQALVCQFYWSSYILHIARALARLCAGQTVEQNIYWHDLARRIMCREHHSAMQHRKVYLETRLTIMSSARALQRLSTAI